MRNLRHAGIESQLGTHLLGAAQIGAGQQVGINKTLVREECGNVKGIGVEPG